MAQRYKKWKKQTNKFPSKSHLGHYKCLLTLDKNKLNPTLQDVTTTLLQLRNNMLNAATISGIAWNVGSYRGDHD